MPHLVTGAALALALALAPAAGAAPAASAPDAPPRVDAELFATNNTATITDAADPRLQLELQRFARTVTRLAASGGATPLRSRLLDGVFFSSRLGTPSFERSRRFALDDVTPAELHQIAERVRVRFGQESVLTFDRLPAGAARVDGLELEVPGVTAQALRDGLLADAEARERLFGGSVTRDGRLLLIAGLADEGLARRFARRLGGDLEHAIVRYGDREFVG
jgi:hypothetical protein